MPASNRLTPLQRRILGRLEGLGPGWPLTGGAALAGFYLAHRETRDLDLFWRGRETLDALQKQVEARLVADGLAVSDVQTAPACHRLQVNDGEETCLVDLVAEPGQPLEPPRVEVVGSASIPVETPHEILVRKLCALLSRSELRDLEDIAALVESGENLERALANAPSHDAGFSPLTLAWILREFDVVTLATALGWLPARAEAMLRFRDSLTEQIRGSSRPS